MRKKIFLCASLLLLCFLLGACGITESAIVTPSPATETLETPTPAPSYPSGQGKVIISEIMASNKAALTDDDGNFPDWIELHNLTEENCDLTGWSLSDDSGHSWTFPSLSLSAGEYRVLFAEKLEESQSFPDSERITFGFSKKDILTLSDRNGDPVCTVTVFDDNTDCSLIPAEDALAFGCKTDGSYSQTNYITPGFPNTAEGFDARQDSLVCEGPLEISEVVVENFSFNPIEVDGETSYPDWVEIRNISAQDVNLSDYFLSDKFSKLQKFQLPETILAAGDTIIVLCDKDMESYNGSYPMALFSLSSGSEQLYLSDANGKLIDYASLRDIPYGGSYGRVEGENGWFYFSEATPIEESFEYARRVTAKPVSAEPDGVFDNVSTVTVELSGPGTIYYTLDSTVPVPESSEVYTEPIHLKETTIVRAICVEDNELPSRTLTLSYIINEDLSLPVVSVVSDDKANFTNMYTNGYKITEVPGSVSYYGDDGTFTAACGLKLHGDTSRVLAKKNISLRFRGCYGDETLKYDIFGDGDQGGVTEFTNLIIRAGQDQNNTIIRNELVETLALEFSDSLITQRSKYVAFFVDGEYRGIHTIIEKTNEAQYASLMGVSKDSVVLNESSIYNGDAFYTEVLYKVYYEDMRDDAAYQEVCSVLDIDSLIDWSIIEGWSGNYDMQSGNLRFVKTTEGEDTRWKLMLYDLDQSLLHYSYCFVNVISYPNQISPLNASLLKNPDYRNRFLTRAAEAFSGVLAPEHVLAEIDELSAQIDPDVKREAPICYLEYSSWQEHVASLRAWFDGSTVDWNLECIDQLCTLCSLSNEERIHYFGDYLGE